MILKKISDRKKRKVFVKGRWVSSIQNKFNVKPFKALDITDKSEIMKKFNIINNIVDVDVFRKEFMPDLPVATFEQKNGENYIYVNNKFANLVANHLKRNGVRYILMTEKQVEYKGYNVTVSEDSDFYYIDFNTGLGEGTYPKEDWTLEKALEDQANIDKEN